MKARYLLPICALALSIPMFANTLSNDDDGDKNPPMSQVYNAPAAQDMNVNAQADDSNLSLSEGSTDQWWGGWGWGGLYRGYGLGWGGYGGWYGGYWPYYSYVYPYYYGYYW
jgi:hypothetical protein